MRRLLVAAAFLTCVAARADQKNIQILDGLSDLELQRTMNMIRGSLGVHCDFCHVVDDKTGWDFASDAKMTKETARDMILMVEKINREQFAGRPMISCNTCHRGSTRPVSMVSLPQTPPPFPTPIPPKPELPALSEVVKRYTAALGDVSRLQMPRAMKGTREGSDGKPLPLDIQESKGRVHIVVQMPNGKLEQGYDAASGWSRNARGVQPLRQSDLDNFRQLTTAFAPLLPASIPADARVIGKETIGTQDTVIVAARLDEEYRQRLYFDTATGLLVRRMIIRDSSIGSIPQQIDFEDYRDAGGTKFPHIVRMSLVDPWVSSTRRYTEVKLGAPVDDAVFKQPADEKPPDGASASAGPPT